MGIVKRQSVQSSVITYIGIAIGYVNLIFLYPQFLTKDEFGLTRLLIAVATIFSQFSLLGSSVSILRFFPYLDDKKSGHHGFLAFCVLVSLLGFITFSVIFLVMSDSIQSFFIAKSPLFISYYYFIFPLSFFLMFFELFFMYMRSLYKTVVPALIKEIFLRLFQTIAIVLLMLRLVNFNGFMILFLGSYVLQLLLIILYAAFLKQLFLFSKIDFKNRLSKRQVIRYSLFLFGAAIAAYYTSNIDQILLGALIGLSSNAVYSIAFFVGTVIQIPGRAMNSVAIPIVSEAWKKNDLAKLQELYRQTSLNQLIIGGFIFLLIWINTGLLLTFLKPEYQEVKWVIFIVGIGKLFDLATGINGEILVVSKHSKAILLTNFFLIFISTAANYFLIPVWGVRGSAVATGLSLMFYNLIRMGFLYYIYRLQPFTTETIKALLLLLASFGIYYLLPATGNIWISSIYQSMVVSVIIAISILFFHISPEITESYKWARKKTGF